MRLDQFDELNERESRDSIDNGIAWVCLTIIVAGALAALQLIFFPQ